MRRKNIRKDKEIHFETLLALHILESNVPKPKTKQPNVPFKLPETEPESKHEPVVDVRFGK